MARYVLVHGAFHAAWSWYRIKPRLEAGGHRVLAPDLPGHGTDMTPVNDCTLEAYAERVCAALDAERAPAILVGHSLGGAVISRAAELMAEKVAALVYVAAFLVSPGKCIRDYSTGSAGSALYDNVEWAADRSTAWLPPGKFAAAFCHDAPAEVAALGGLLSRPEPMKPPAEPVQLSANRFGRIARVYIECTGDRALYPGIQRRMHEASPCQAVHRLETSHSPMLSQPDSLTGLLMSVAERRLREA